MSGTIVLAGLLKTVAFEGWEAILDGLTLSSVSITDQCWNALELSYKQLPVYLRPCFLYFGAFPEDEEVSVRRLVRLWIAEGLVERDAAEHYLNDLIGRSLIMVAKERSLGGVKSCRIHDLIHGFCIQKAKDEHFFHFLRGYDELAAFHEPHSLQRLCIHSNAQHVKESKLFCPRARSIIVHSSDPIHISAERMLWFYLPTAIHIFKLLAVLDLEQLHFGYRFPPEIKQLVQLAFLAIRSQVSQIPSWIGDLSNLQTLILGEYCKSQLPGSFWNLQRLESLCMEFDRCFPEGNLNSSVTLHELDRISGAIIPYRRMEHLLRKFPNICRLKCELEYCKDDSSSLIFPDILSRIESLYLRYYSAEVSEVHSSPSVPLDEFSLPATLKKLTLQFFRLSWRNMSTIGTLPNLQVLKLRCTTFEGETWEMKEGEFDQIKTLKLVGLELVSWLSDSDDQLSCLQKLVLSGCFSLEEIPCCLENISTLQVVEVDGCYDTVVDMVKQIDEVRGDSSLKIITNIWKSDP